MREPRGWLYVHRAQEQDRRLHAVFASGSDVREALERLADDGITAEEVEVRSSIPLDEDIRPSGQVLRSRIPLLAVLGGVAGGVAAFMLAAFTARAYPIPTGGMPIVPLMPTGIIAFEGIGVGSILFTVAGVLFECGLPRLRWRPGPFDQDLAAGKIVVAAKCADEASQEWASKALATEMQERG